MSLCDDVCSESGDEATDQLSFDILNTGPGSNENSAKTPISQNNLQPGYEDPPNKDNVEDVNVSRHGRYSLESQRSEREFNEEEESSRSEELEIQLFSHKRQKTIVHQPRARERITLNE